MCVGGGGLHWTNGSAPSLALALAPPAPPRPEEIDSLQRCRSVDVSPQSGVLSVSLVASGLAAWLICRGSRAPSCSEGSSTSPPTTTTTQPRPGHRPPDRPPHRRGLLRLAPGPLQSCRAPWERCRPCGHRGGHPCPPAPCPRSRRRRRPPSWLPVPSGPAVSSWRRQQTHRLPPAAGGQARSAGVGAEVGAAPRANWALAQSDAWIGPTWLARCRKPSLTYCLKRFTGGTSSPPAQPRLPV